MDRRTFFSLWPALTAAGAGWPWLTAATAATSASRVRKPTGIHLDGLPHVGRRFDGERMRYVCGFFIFPRAADAQVSFRMLDDQRCRAVLWGRTRGIIGLVTLFREDRYIADMRLVDGGRRLQSVQLHELVNIGRMRDRKVHVYDQQKRVVIEKTVDVETGRVKHVKSKPMPPTGPCDDYLTAFYNFRNGVYGPLAPGRHYHIQSNPHGHMKQVDIEVATMAEARAKRPKVRYGLDWHWMLKVKLDKNFVHSRDGLFQGWLAKDGLPVGGIIPNVNIFGDVWGYLVDRRPPKRERS